jgi:hypothetical protein
MLDLVSALKSVDFPTLGSPTSPALILMELLSRFNFFEDIVQNIRSLFYYLVCVKKGF